MEMDFLQIARILGKTPAPQTSDQAQVPKDLAHASGVEVKGMATKRVVHGRRMSQPEGPISTKTVEGGTRYRLPIFNPPNRMPTPNPPQTSTVNSNVQTPKRNTR